VVEDWAGRSPYSGDGIVYSRNMIVRSFDMEFEGTPYTVRVEVDMFLVAKRLFRTVASRKFKRTRLLKGAIKIGAKETP